MAQVVTKRRFPTIAECIEHVAQQERTYEPAPRIDSHSYLEMLLHRQVAKHKAPKRRVDSSDKE